MNALQELRVSLKVELSKRDIARLQPHLVGWNHLNEILLLGQTGTEDIKKLLLLEVSTKQRRQIMWKLSARLKSVELEQLREHLLICLKKT